MNTDKYGKNINIKSICGAKSFKDFQIKILKPTTIISKFNQICELRFLYMFVSKCNEIIKKQNITHVNYFRGKGIDIIFYSENNKQALSVEIKGSMLKHDYMNKNDYNKGDKRKVKLFGNQLKYKEFESNGALKADFVVLVCCMKEKKISSNDGDWQYWIFDKSDISQLRPKATLFIPSYVPTIMHLVGNSVFTDEYIDLKKGYCQIITPPIIQNNESEEIEKNWVKDFLEVWDDEIKCHLLFKEHKALIDLYDNGIDKFKNNWSKFDISNQDKVNKVSNFIWTESLSKYKCAFLFKEDEIPKKYLKDCRECVEKIKSFDFQHKEREEQEMSKLNYNVFNESKIKPIFIEWFTKSILDKDVFDSFIYLWISFISWASCVTLKDTVSQQLCILAKDNYLGQLLNRLNEKNVFFIKKIQQFKEILPIFDIRDMRKVDIENYKEATEKAFRNKKVRRVPKDWNNDSKDQRENLSLKDFLFSIYQIRCNLMHGGKLVSSKDNKLRVKLAKELLFKFYSKILAEKHSIKIDDKNEIK